MSNTVRLSDVVIKNTGTRNPLKQAESEFVYIDVASVDNQSKRITQAKQMVSSAAPSRARKVVRAGDVIVSTIRPNLNAVALVPHDLDGQIASTGFCVLRAEPHVVLPEYLFYFVRSKVFVDGLTRLIAGAMYPAVTDGQVLEQFIRLPSLQEQRRIVDFLSRAEGIVHLRRLAQAKTQAIIPALFLDMFGDPESNPKGWPVRMLGELLCNGPTNGLYKHQSAYGSGTPILRIDAFYDGKVKDLNSLKRVTLAGTVELNRYALAQGDIVINRVNSPQYLGKSAIIPELAEPTVYESNMMRFAVDADQVLPQFVIALLQQPLARRHFNSKAKHAINQSSINQQDVKSLLVIVPPLTAQVRFKEHCRSISDIIVQQHEALAKAEATFQALLARAFNGNPKALEPTEEATLA